MPVLTQSSTTPGLFGWWRAADARARRALVAAAFGWMLDAFDVMLFSMVLAALIADLGLTKPQAGLLGSITLVGGAAGGLVFGFLADRHGRTRALMGSARARGRSATGRRARHRPRTIFRRLPRPPRRRHGRRYVDERVHALRLVGVERVGSGVSVAAGGAGRHRPERLRDVWALAEAVSRTVAGRGRST